MPLSNNERFREAAIRVVQNYVRLNSSDFSRILETEKRFEFVVGNALINGQIDLLKRVDESGNLKAVEIIDFKADRSGDRKENGNNTDDGLYDTDYQKQLRYYALACLSSLDLNPQKAVVHHLDSGAVDEIDISSGKLEETAKDIENSVRLITDGKFPPKAEKSKCGACDYRIMCSHKSIRPVKGK